MAKVALDLEADIQPVSDFRANASEMLEQVKRTGRPLVLTKRGRGAAVLLDIAVFQRLLDEIDELRDVRRGMADVETGDVVDHADVASSLLGRLSERR